jgi:guanylate kinase
VDIDVYGAMRLKKHYGQNTLSLFIQAPDIQTLEDRLRGRGTESEQSIRERVQKASEELSVAKEFDHRIINDNLQHAIETTKNIITEFLND